MSKALDIVMAGVISGLVAFTTSKIGIAGTVLGAVLGAMLYQIMSHYVREPLGRVKTQKVETRVVYAFPLIIILVIEIIYVSYLLYLTPQQTFYFLEGITGWNLFRAIGIGLLCMGIYPIIQPENIKRLYGYIILVLGIIALLHGFIDFESSIVDLYAFIYLEFGVIISLIEISALIFVIVSIIKESVTIIHEDEHNEN